MRALCVVGLLGGLFVLGCGGSDGPAGSCRIAATNGGGETCIDFAKGYSESSAKDVCSQASGSTYSADVCTTTNRVGHCTQSSPDGAFTQVLSFYAPTTAADAMTSCTAQGGTFAAN